MNDGSNEKTMVDRWLIGIKNHPIFALIVLLGIIVVAIGSVTESIEKIKKFVSSTSKEDTSVSSTEISTLPSKEEVKNVDKPENSTVILKQGFSYSGVDSCGDKRDKEESIKVCDAGAKAYAKSNSVTLVSVVVSDYSSTISKKKEPWPSNARSCKSKGTAKCEVKISYKN
jgi:hypothetical protein